MPPVEPAEIAPWARPSRTVRQAVTIDDPGFERMRRLVQVTVNGVAAGLQTTG